MNWESLIAFNVILAAAIVSPGAALLYFLRTTVASGRMAGLLTGFGLALAAACWTLAALVGLESLFALVPWSYAVLKVAGACYLLYLAVQTWRQAKAPVDGHDRASARHFMSGFLVNLGNPKSVLFAAAVIVVVFPQGLGPADIALVTVNHLLLELLFYGAFATLLGTQGARRGYLRLKSALDRVAGTLLGALGLRLLLER